MNGAVTEPDLIVRREGAAGVIRLNRPKAINALTLEMARDLDNALDDFAADPNVALILVEGAGERGLCAGGDIVGLYNSAREGGDLGKVFWREEYITNAKIAKYPKPYVAFMDGLVMGGGVGIAGHGSHRIVTDKTKIAMPEVGIGFFPDVGGTWLLTRSPGEIGTYFGLTGDIMNGADAIHAQFADAYVPTVNWAALRQALTEAPSGASAAQVGGIIARFAGQPAKGPAELHQAEIDRCFGHETIEQIVAALQNDASEFAQAALKTLRIKSPTSLKVTLKLLRAARHRASLEECLVHEYRAALQVFVSDDFVEGVRAAVIDKDRKPKWRPATIAEVTPEIVARYFEDRGDDELKFPG
ncbi:enoyl-CoA hydratase [Rhodopseudomonas thermotolerans]|uniref:3-hydroxyisobutyryl-CoA hydrolase n=2 Tax=Rhodopseudomonas TaxID=1073 RepID=A0A336JLM3_9BRAD|nr:MULTISPECIES: enoyl-CoA hydratase/isomerase family protein [Rhodopseudomonas]RED42036.1 enoyl-CoA hydratase [Rhodopseudomonas pentothenatexigens]REG07497.1 enoyl-CoA hydratase [Rhodopseudomonas thermotolerans]SSW89396.1 enoyl-CoA hydratase [Rhodopseudomonas pentothenatexigens]